MVSGRFFCATVGGEKVGTTLHAAYIIVVVLLMVAIVCRTAVKPPDATAVMTWVMSCRYTVVSSTPTYVYLTV